jgi:phage shock protein A
MTDPDSPEQADIENLDLSQLAGQLAEEAKQLNEEAAKTELGPEEADRTREKIRDRLDSLDGAIKRLKRATQSA